MVSRVLGLTVGRYGVVGNSKSSLILAKSWWSLAIRGIAAFSLRAEDALQLPLADYMYADLSPMAATPFGHAFVVRIFDPNGERHALLARTAEDYLTYLYAAIAICHGRQDDPLRLLALTRGLAERAPPSFA